MCIRVSAALAVAALAASTALTSGCDIGKTLETLPNTDVPDLGSLPGLSGTWSWTVDPLVAEDPLPAALPTTAIARRADGDLVVLSSHGGDTYVHAETAEGWSNEDIFSGVVSSADALVVTADHGWRAAFGRGGDVVVAGSTGLSTTAGTAADLARAISLGLTPDGTLHAVWGDEDRLMIASADDDLAAAWSDGRTLATGAGMRIERTALAVDSTGALAVAFTDWSPAAGGQGQVQVIIGADQTGGEPIASPVPSAGDAGAGLGLAFEGDQLWLAFTDKSDGGAIKLATPEGAGWSVETVATLPSSLNLAVDLAVTSEGPIVAFYNADGRLELATQDGDDWRRQTVADGAQLGMAPALVIAADGKPILAFHDGDQRRLMLAR